jgi:nitrogen fixation protein NifB
MLEIRTAAEKIIPQMKHCSRCRADAVGLLKDDRSPEFRDVMRNCSLGVNAVLPDKQYVAVASREGMLVNEHLGEAERFQIWGLLPAGYTMLEERTAPLPGTGIHRWLALAELLKDCRAVLVNAAGETPVQILADHDIHVIEMTGFIQAGLDVVYVGGDPNTLKGRKGGCAKSAGSCSGSGAGCG